MYKDFIMMIFSKHVVFRTLIFTKRFYEEGGAEPRISGGSYKRSFVYVEVRIQYTNSYTVVVYCIRNVAEETRIQYRYSYTDSKLGSK